MEKGKVKGGNYCKMKNSSEMTQAEKIGRINRWVMLTVFDPPFCLIPPGMTLTHCRAAFRCDLMPAQVGAAVFLLLWPICFVLAGVSPCLRLPLPRLLAANLWILDSVENR